VSRSVARLEAALGTRLIHRITRQVELTSAGLSLVTRCTNALSVLGEAFDYVGSLASQPHGELRISCGIGFGINVLAQQLPAFLQRFPQIEVSLDLSSRPVR
jgi:LysR family transcriptional regulator for bpeEF and oprC